MRRPLFIGLCLLSSNLTACNSREAREALVEATAATIMAVGAAALDAAAQEQAERDARESERRSRRVTNGPGAWRLVREYDADEPDDDQLPEGTSTASEPDSESNTTAPLPPISIGRCMVCR